jgi:hypothetical protein
MAEWTIEDVAARFEEAASTGRRLPPVRVQGYFNCWPAIVRKEWENLLPTRRVYRPFPQPRGHRPDAGDDALGAVAGGGAAASGVDARQALRLAGHHDPLCLRPHDGVAAVAAGTRCRRVLPGQKSHAGGDSAAFR